MRRLFLAWLGGMGLLLLGWHALALEEELERLIFRMALQEGLGEEAPEFALQDLQGRTVRLKDFRGKVVLLSLFNTW